MPATAPKTATTPMAVATSAPDLRLLRTGATSSPTTSLPQRDAETIGSDPPRMLDPVGEVSADRTVCPLSPGVGVEEAGDSSGDPFGGGKAEELA
jgi:hypothetical protein